MGRTHWGRGLTGREEDGRFPKSVGQTRFQQRSVDHLALARFHAVDVGRQYRIARVDPGIQISDRHADLDRRLARTPCYADHSAHSLGHKIKTTAIAIWARLSKARNRAINQGCISRRKRIITEAEAIHSSGTEVFDQNVGPGRELSEHFLALVGLEVD